MPNDKQPTPGYVAVLTNQMLVYKHRQVIPRIVILRIESVAKMPKLNPRIKLGISSDLGIANPRFILHFYKKGQLSLTNLSDAKRLHGLCKSSGVVRCIAR